MVRQPKLSTSTRVKMTVYGSSGTPRTSLLSLTQIRRARLREEKAREEQAKATTREMQEQLEEAGLEIGETPSLEYEGDLWDREDGDCKGDHQDSDEDEECVGVYPVFSKYFRTAGQSRTADHRRHDTRTRTQRNEHAHDAWQSQMPALVDAFLSWKYSANDGLADDRVAHVSNHVFHVAVIGVFDHEPCVPITQRAEEPANAALIRIGSLGCSPTQPRVAVRLECLELYHQLRRRQSSFGIQAFTKVLCALHNVTYSQHLRVQFSIAFDIYLNILRCIQLSLKKTLGHEGIKWKLQGACPACAYEQPNEPSLHPARLHTMDGNQSVKRLDGSGSADHRIFDSDYFLPETEVAHFKDDVRNRAGEAKRERATCTDNWTAARAVDEEQVWVFEQTGIFLLACRHGFVECIAEMKRSGELAKYGLAVVNKVLDICGNDQAIGHDIGCSSKKTVAASSIGAKAQAKNLTIVVNAFHGFAHNRTCQLENHPLYQLGFGNEDLETCEHIFSSSNSTASLIRHASLFHWKQFLDLHFDQWDNDKYFELSRFLFNNYKQALRIIHKWTPLLDQFKRDKDIVDDDFKMWHHEELQYLKNCTSEAEDTTMAVTYVDLLEKLQFAEATYGSVTAVPYLMYSPQQFTRSAGLNTIARQCTNAVTAEYSSALRRLQLQMNVVENFEKQHGITQRWTSDDPQYKAVAEYVKHRAFIRMVDELEGLVVQRLFELSKANLASTGYKMRKHISKAITRRSAAIRTALEKYNRMAPRQQPPRPKLGYAEVIGYSMLGEFALLKHSRFEILSKPWAVSDNREMMTKYFKIKRSHEEISRLNVEVRRLHAWVEHEDRQLQSVARRLAEESSLIAGEVEQLCAERHRVNDVHRARLRRIYALSGFTGIVPPLHEQGLEEDSEELEEDGEDEVVNDEALRLDETLNHITT